MGVTVDDARAIAGTLPRSYEALVRDRLKFRLGQIVYAAFSQDETIMGFGFPREERGALVPSEPDKFLIPSPSDMRYRWVLGLRRPDRHDALEYATTRTLELLSCLHTASACFNGSITSSRRWTPS